ncbi:large subunit ribosomal protein L25 [Arthrobacter stackebrandtii]|uniref:Large ribosomal subunit protein bL25 n=1 Tax=Arthrobacter stackebrandtii TaxID=272161 RepID=A0ABS4YT42_9MICC|nr:50S ribosomal protein L25/general stress protein Ctc [Arthrobacter stackebrandtii]MBP2411567.1 large subunit ribosomal protein L25 [Arthrobacter stackebrandtii]PYG99246.1 50S ribosomal protein L25 [Arthrobacter stackebrandtii]
MSELNLTGEARNEFGKGAARRIRRAKQIPAVIYGHGAAPLHLVLPERETVRAIRGANALLTITLDGEEHLALVKDVQRDPVLQIVEHIDLLTVRKGEKVIVDVPVVLVGEPAPATVVNQEEVVVSVSADATNVPAHIEVTIDGLAAGQHVLAGDLVLPAGVELVTEADLLIVHFAEPVVVAEVEADEAAAE